jgi:hypothetical protein
MLEPQFALPRIAWWFRQIEFERCHREAILVLEQASPNEGKLQKHENLQLFPVFLE